MKIKTMRYKQEQNYGCGLYAVAHALNLGDEYVTPERILASKEGTTIGLLSSWLNESNHNFVIQPLFYCSMTQGTKIPEEYFSLKYTGYQDIISFPLLFSVKYTENSLAHMIAGHLNNGCIYIYDSLKNDEFKTSIEELNKHYYSVYGIFQFITLDGKDIILTP